GLALSAPLLELLMLMARRIGAEALALTPSTFAAASVYDRRFLFVDGAAQGRFLALRGAGGKRPRWLLAWAVELGCMRDAEGQPLPFTPMPMLSPLSRRLIRSFDAKAWAEAREQTGRQVVTLDEEAL
ncbi:deacetylase, partial [Corallococcus sp. AB038B]